METSYFSLLSDFFQVSKFGKTGHLEDGVEHLFLFLSFLIHDFHVSATRLNNLSLKYVQTCQQSPPRGGTSFSHYKGSRIWVSKRGLHLENVCRWTDFWVAVKGDQLSLRQGSCAKRGQCSSSFSVGSWLFPLVQDEQEGQEEGDSLSAGFRNRDCLGPAL